MRRGAMARWVVAVVVLAALAAAPAAGAPEQTPKRGGTVVFGPVGEPNCSEPSRRLRHGRSAVRLDPREGSRAGLHGGSELHPAAGSRLQRSGHEQDSLHLLFDIRREARWSDGVPVTAGDFQFTHRAILERLQQGDVARGPHDLVRSVDRVRAKTFRVVFNRPVANGRRTYLSSSCRATCSPGMIPDRSGKRT